MLRHDSEIMNFTGGNMIKIASAFAFFAMNFGSAQGANVKTTSITIDSPRGGELYAVGQQQTVVLGPKTVARSMLVELSRDGGTTFVILGTIANSKRQQGLAPSLHWTVAAPATGNAVLRVTSTDLRHPGAATTNGFSIGTFIAADSSTASSGFVLTADGCGDAGFLPPAAANGVTTAAGASVAAALNSVAATTKLNANVLADFPKAHVSNSALIPIPDGVDTTVSFDTVKFDSDNCHDFVATPTRLTCKTPSVYFMSGYAGFDANNIDFRHGYLLVNGGTPGANAIASDVRPAINTSDFTVSTIVSLKTGDFIEFVVAQNSGAALNVNVRGFMMTKLP
jgi:hypothetical protein